MSSANNTSTYKKIMKKKALLILVVMTLTTIELAYSTCCNKPCHQPNCCENRSCQSRTSCNTSPCRTTQKQCCEENCCSNTNCKSCTVATEDVSKEATCAGKNCEESKEENPQLQPSCPSGTSSINSTCLSVNNQTVTANIKLENTITNTNYIYVPVNITNTYVNTITTASKPPRDTEKVVVIKPEPSTSTNKLETIYLTEKPRIFTSLIPVPFPYPVPYSVPQHEGCCSVVQPCLQGGGCQSHFSICGSECTQRVMFSPENPCPHTGCSKRDYGVGHSCYHTQQFPFVSCGQVYQDCSRCNQNFYRDYYSYENCRGCFHY